MHPNEILSSENPESLISDIIKKIHQNGPTDQEDLQSLSYLKKYHSDIFEKYEQLLLNVLGLFYKVSDPNDLFSVSYSVFSSSILEVTGQKFTPIQASIYSNIRMNQLFSFSAPTSAGKSYLFRELIRDELGDIIIVVPSRALISEYLIAIRELVTNRKDILVLQFIDDIFRQVVTRRIFVVTPERASEIFKDPLKFNISMFLFDEAHISEEKTRGVTFDALVRRAHKTFPEAKKIFAHPFVENPEAQLEKHQLETSGASNLYNQNTVGKIFVTYRIDEERFYYFSPFMNRPGTATNQTAVINNVALEVLQTGGKILIYVSKSSIYEKKFKEKFSTLMENCNDIIDESAIKLIEQIKEIIAAERISSDLVELMRRGIVIHHGSIPLNVRNLIEEFTNRGYAKICFATSTLLQGVNMPFDMVWVDNFRFLGTMEDKVLGLKNLIGRAGRSTNLNKFDYGYVVVNDRNVPEFSRRLLTSVNISNVSKIEEDISEIEEDKKEFVEAIKDDTIDDTYNLPESKIERLCSSEAQTFVEELLDLMFLNDAIISGSEYRELSETQRDKIKDRFKKLFEISLNRSLEAGELSVLNTAITILLWLIQGKSFREVLGLRFHYITKRSDQLSLTSRLQRGEINEQQYNALYRNLKLKFSPQANVLPDKSRTTPWSAFNPHDHISSINYDVLVYDTYDYIDKVITFSMMDIYVSAFGKYYEATSDSRADSMMKYFRYGTNDPTEILLLRYGFSMEDTIELLNHIESISEDIILFKDTVDTLQNPDLLALVNRYR